MEPPTILGDRRSEILETQKTGPSITNPDSLKRRYEIISLEKLQQSPKISSLDNKKAVFSALEISENDDENVRLLDTKGNLSLYHYITPNASTNHIRGVVLENIDNSLRVVATSFPYTDELTIDNTKGLGDVFDDNVEVTYAHEGTIIRVYYADGSWQFSTHKRIDASKSKWAGPPFKDLFFSVWDSKYAMNFDTFFDKKLCYVFLLTTPENRLVNLIAESSIMIVGVFNGLTKVINYSIPLPTAVKLSVSSVENFLQIVPTLDKTKYSGLIAYNPVKRLCMKFVETEYSKLRAIRGNEPNIKLRYLELREEDDDRSLYDLFPEKRALFESLEEDIDKLAGHLTNFYMKRYVYRSYLELPPEDHHIIKTVHDTLKKGSVHRAIQGQIKMSSPRQLNALINHMHGKFKKRPPKTNDS